MATSIHLPSRSSTAQAWRNQAAAASPPPAGQDPAQGPSHLPLAVTLPPPQQSFTREEAEAHAQAARAQSEAAASAAGTPTLGESTIQSSKAYATRMVKAWADNDAKAREAGVNLRKSAFINKLIGTAAAFIVLGVAAAATALTAGAGSPFLAVAITRTALLVGDSLCAWKDWQRSKEPQPRPLPMGANCLGNAIYALAKAGKASDATAKDWAKYLGGAVTVGLASTSLVLGMPQEGISLLSSMLRYLSSGAVIAATTSQAKAADRYDEVAQARDRAKVDLFTHLMDRAALPVGSKAYLDWCAELRDELKRVDPQDKLSTAFDQLAHDAWVAIHHRKGAPDLVDGDRSTMASRAVNDILGMQAGANFAWTAATHGGAMSALGSLLNG